MQIKIKKQFTYKGSIIYNFEIVQTLLAYSHKYKSRNWQEKIKIVLMLKH